MALACRFRRFTPGNLRSRLLPDSPAYLRPYDLSLLGCEKQTSIRDVLQILEIPIASHDAGRGVGRDVQQYVTEFVGNRMAQNLGYRCGRAPAAFESRLHLTPGEGFDAVVEDVYHLPVTLRAGCKPHHTAGEAEAFGHGARVDL